MSARYVVKPRASEDLDDYADYLAKEASLEMALRFLDAAHGTFALIATQPEMGWRSRIQCPGLEAWRVFRVSGFEHMLVLYRPHLNTIDILSVVHGSRNLRALLRREGLE